MSASFCSAKDLFARAKEEVEEVLRPNKTKPDREMDGESPMASMGLDWYIYLHEWLIFLGRVDNAKSLDLGLTYRYYSHSPLSSHPVYMVVKSSHPAYIGSI